MTRPYLAFPPLSWTFRSRGYINSAPSGIEEDMGIPFRTLTISVITGNEEVESAYLVVYPYPSDSELDN